MNARRVARRRGAYLELGVSHGDVQPMFWWLAAQCGVELEFFVLRTHQAQQALARVAQPVAATYLGGSGGLGGPDGGDCETLVRQWAETRDVSQYDFVVLGSAEPAFVAALRCLPVRKLIVVHRPDGLSLPAEDETWCLLTEHGRGTLGDDRAVRFLPYFAGNVTLDEKPGSKVFCVPGTVQVRRRNYGSLMRALRELRDEGFGPRDFRIRIVGRWTERWLPSFLPARLDGDRLRDALERDGLTGMVEFPDDEYAYPQFYERLRTSRYVLPLIDDFYAASRPYLDWKCSSALTQGIAWLNIPVINETYARKLGIDFGYQYRFDDVAGGIRAALAAGDDDEQLSRLAAYRMDHLERATAAFTTWLEQ